MGAKWVNDGAMFGTMTRTTTKKTPIRVSLVRAR